jgi:hypothetical protein
VKLDPIKLTNADPQRVADAAYSIVDRLQQFSAEERALAGAVYLHLTAAMHRIAPQDLMTPADNIMSSPEGQYRRKEFLAARVYLENER